MTMNIELQLSANKIYLKMLQRTKTVAGIETARDSNSSS